VLHQPLVTILYSVTLSNSLINSNQLSTHSLRLSVHTILSFVSNASFTSSLLHLIPFYLLHLYLYISKLFAMISYPDFMTEFLWDNEKFRKISFFSIPWTGLLFLLPSDTHNCPFQQRKPFSQSSHSIPVVPLQVTSATSCSSHHGSYHCWNGLAIFQGHLDPKKAAVKTDRGLPRTSVPGPWGVGKIPEEARSAQWWFHQALCCVAK
jgi:hypothetical protein